MMYISVCCRCRKFRQAESSIPLLSVPLFIRADDQDRSRGRRAQVQLGLAMDPHLFTAMRGLYGEQEAGPVMIQAHPILQPFVITPEPDQDRRKVGFSPLPADRTVNGEMQHAFPGSRSDQ